LPTTEIGAPINRALLPGFAKIENAREVAAAYTSAVGVLALLALPAAALILVVAPFLVPAMLGLKWLEAVPVMQIMAFNGALLLFHASICTVLVSRGFPLRVGVANASYVMLLIILLFLFSTHFGVVGAAYAALITSLLSTPIYLYQVKRCLGVSPGLFFGAVLRPLLACAATAALLRWTLPYHEATTSNLAAVAWLLVGTVAGLGIYSGVLWCLWSLVGRPAGAERAVIDRVRSFVMQRLASRPASARESN
jgi:O-antigen/teichoic acid export membrane protein